MGFSQLLNCKEEKHRQTHGDLLCVWIHSFLLPSQKIGVGIFFCPHIPGGVFLVLPGATPSSLLQELDGNCTGPSPMFGNSASSRFLDKRGTQVWSLRKSLFWCFCLEKLPLTNTFVAHTLSVGHLPTCPSVEMAMSLIPGPKASSIKPRCQPPVSWLQETLPSQDSFLSPPLENTESPAHSWLFYLVPAWRYYPL